MTILITLSAITYSEYFSGNSCDENYPSSLIPTEDCLSNHPISLDEFKPSFPH